MRIPVLLCAGLMVAGTQYAQDVELQVELQNQVSTTSSQRGDLVSARVLAPPNLQGDTIEGRVSEVHSGAKMGGKSVLAISFETLRHGGMPIPISTQMKSATNSKGRANLDDEGRAVQRATGNLVKTGSAAGVGGLIGGIAGGGKGAAIGAAAGGVAGAILVQVAADAPNITFLPGSRMVLTTRARGNQNLLMLASNPNAPAAPGASTLPPLPPAPPAPSAYQPTATQQAAPQTTAAAAPAPTPAPPPAGGGSGQPDLTAVKSEFVPGEKALLFDDFTDMAGDEPPPHWKVRGGTAELRKGEGIRQLTFTARRTDVTPNITGLPKNFTMEVDYKIQGHGQAVNWDFRKKGAATAMVLRLASVYTKLHIRCYVGTERITDDMVPMDWNQPIKTALWLQNGRMRFYVNGTRIFDVNQIQLPDLEPPTAAINSEQDPKAPRFVGIQYARIAESTPDFSQVITNTGRYVSHGILFDTDSDRLKPESGPVIKMIARGLETNANLKLQIEGHTDSVGNADHNKDLSKRRADAVKAVLVEQFQVDAARLTTTGMGSTKPIDSNDTAQGRSQNRRVEFVRQQ